MELKSKMVLPIVVTPRWSLVPEWQTIHHEDLSLSSLAASLIQSSMCLVDSI